MIIVGAGMAGLLAANYFRKRDPLVIEAQQSLPNNHEALLRFRTHKVADVLGIKFREVSVRKEIFSNNMFVDRPNVWVANQYAIKMTGKVTNRSIWNVDAALRYIAPRNLIEQMAKGLNISYDVSFDKGYIDGNPIISTIPMPIMMDIVGWKEKPKFLWRPVWVVAFDIDQPACDVHQTIYFPDITEQRYRASITGNHVAIELNSAPADGGDRGMIDDTLECFGIPHSIVKTSNLVIKRQQYGKMLEIDDKVRKEFIYYMTHEHNVYSLGRFATWRNILLDDVVSDLKVVDDLISLDGARSYTQRLHETRQLRADNVNSPLRTEN